MTIQWRDNAGIVDVIARLRIHGAEHVAELRAPRGRLTALLRPRPGGTVVALVEQIG
ncbi:hypothetical protein AB0O28_09215 [Microbispora sp. NPDC088329]|uniref:hypothetical protein n=1 Tax=Microbispora sp. NPDC088329 TaxID=3154869 RepID=UPI00343DC1C9